MSGGREAIVKAAIQVFAQMGYAGASTRAICKTAGVSKPVLYYHFRSKEHLYQELMTDSFGNYRKTLLRALQTRGGLRERLVHMVQTDFRATSDCDPDADANVGPERSQRRGDLGIGIAIAIGFCCSR